MFGSHLKVEVAMFAYTVWVYYPPLLATAVVSLATRYWVTHSSCVTFIDAVSNLTVPCPSAAALRRIAVRTTDRAARGIGSTAIWRPVPSIDDPPTAWISNLLPVLSDLLSHALFDHFCQFTFALSMSCDFASSVVCRDFDGAFENFWNS